MTNVDSKRDKDAVVQQDLLRLDERVRAIEERLYPDTVIARSFFLVDRSGKIRGSFSLSGDDRPSFTMNDADGKERLNISLLEDGSPRVYLCDANEEARVILGADDSPSVVVNDATGQAQVTLRHSEDGGVVSVIGGSVIVYDSELKAQTVIAMLPDGTPALAMLNADGKVGCELFGGGPGCGPHFRLVNKEGETVFQAPPREGPGGDDEVDWSKIGMRT